MFYMGTKAYKMDSAIEKTTDNLKSFVKQSMKDAIVIAGVIVVISIV